MQLYNDGSWYCFGCRAGGTVYDFAVNLWLTGQSSGGRSGWKLRGREFLWVRQGLANIFLSNSGTIRAPASIGSGDSALTLPSSFR